MNTMFPGIEVFGLGKRGDIDMDDADLGLKKTKGQLSPIPSSRTRTQRRKERDNRRKASHRAHFRRIHGIQ
ncbi:MAG: hypothetical protein ABR875_02495 [Minisyncoccia bacterium]|jgi:hypothetical protein